MGAVAQAQPPSSIVYHAVGPHGNPLSRNTEYLRSTTVFSTCTQSSVWITLSMVCT
jgi:hypothetical protein